jgi:hypothetical protein
VLVSALGNFAAVLIDFHGYALHIHSCDRSILVIKRLLRFDETAGLFSDDARIGVPGLMQVDGLDASGPRILLQIIGK